MNIEIADQCDLVSIDDVRCVDGKLTIVCPFIFHHMVDELGETVDSNDRGRSYDVHNMILDTHELRNLLVSMGIMSLLCSHGQD